MIITQGVVQGTKCTRVQRAEKCLFGFMRATELITRQQGRLWPVAGRTGTVLMPAALKEKEGGGSYLYTAAILGG